MYTGSILGLALSPHMVEVLSWPSVFYIFGAVGIVWYFLWQSQAASSPAADPAISAEERSYIEETSVLAVRICFHWKTVVSASWLRVCEALHGRSVLIASDKQTPQILARLLISEA